MSHLAPKWEAAWHPGKKRYYYQDRVSGKSSWSRPVGCTLKLPTEKPADYDREVPPPPEQIPNGYKVAFDWNHKRYFYYNVQRHEERSWFRPQPVLGFVPDDRPQVLTQEHRPRTGKSDLFMASHAWDAESFKHRIQEAHAGKDNHILRDILTEVVDSNSRLLSGRASLPVPYSVLVPYQDCLNALQEQKIEDYGAEPKISVSCATLAESVLFFGGQDPRRVVCCINQADGIRPGGGYVSGEKGGEEDLCRRVPALHSSLHEVREEAYPIGPSTCHGADFPNKYADVIFTPHVTLARGQEDDGFPILPPDRRVQVSVISAAPPLVRSRNELATQELLSSAVLSLYVAPVFKEPRCTTLILSLWGCGQGVKDQDMMTYLVRGLIGELPGVPIKLGRLYHEVHFAVPPASYMPEGSKTKDIMDMFRSVLKHERIPYTEL